MDTSGPIPTLSDNDGPATMPEYTAALKTALAGPWQNIPLLNNWAAFAGQYHLPQWRKVGATIELRGLLKSGTFGSTPIATMPAGARPAKTVMLTTLGAVGSTRALYALDVNAPGNLVCTGSGVAAYLTLDGLSYPLD